MFAASFFVIIMTDSFIKLQSRSRIFSWIIFLLPALTLTTHYGIGFIEVAFLLAAIVYAKPLWLRRAELFQSSLWIVIAFAFSLAVAVASSLWSGFEAYSLDNAIRQLLAVTAIGLVVLSRPKVRWFWYGLFVGAIGTAGLALYQNFFTQVGRVHGFHQHIMFGDIAMVIGVMSMAGIPLFTKTRLSVLPYIALSAGITASVLSGSRGGWIALLFAFIPLYRSGRQSVTRKILMTALFVASLLVVAYFVPQLKINQRLAEISTDITKYKLGDPNSSAGSRFEMWKGAWKIFSAHPLTGIGRNNFHKGLSDLVDRNEIHPTVLNYYHAHNEIFQALATEGIPGVLALLLLYGAPLVFFMRALRKTGENQPYALAGLLLVLSYISFGLTQVLSSHHVGTAFYSLTVSVLAGICILTQRAEP